MLSFLELDPKTNETLNLPPKVVKHTYLETKLGLAGRLDDPDLKLYTGKLYNGVTEADLTRLRDQEGLYLLFSNGKTAYFGDAETCALVDTEVLQNFSDSVAYGSLPVSDARASTLREQRRVLVIDDEADPSDTNAVWGDEPLLRRDGTPVDPLTVQQAAFALGDSFGLITPTLQRELTAQEVVTSLQGKLAIAQTLSFEGSSLNADGIDAQLKQLLPDQLWQTADVQQRLSPETEYTDRFVVEPFQLRRDGSAVVTWSYAIEDSDAPLLQGKALVTPSPDSTYQLTALGGTPDQQSAVNQNVNALVQSQNTPFQFRAGVPEWQGVIKGTCRASALCQELEVDAIIPKSAIKGDGKTTPVGLHTVDHLFWSRKAEAKAGQQKLGAQVLVNLPESTQVDIEPKVAAALEQLQAAVADPRLVADLYCAKHERRQELLEAQTFGEDAEAPEREDWVYSVLKADARPTTLVTSLESRELQTLLPEATWAQLQATAAQGLPAAEFVEQANSVLSAEPTAELVKRFTVDDIVSPVAGDATDPTTFSTEQRGGYGQMLEHEKVVESLNRFLQNEWRDLALGGVTVPSALAQPHGLLQPDEVCFAGMPHGAKVAIYRSPVANVSAFTVLTNNLDVIREQDREAFRQNGVTYLNPATAKAQLIDFDGDTVALIPALELQKVKAQTLDSLQPNEVYVPGLADGQAVTLYHSGDQVSEFVNNTALADLPEPNNTRTKLNQVYVHPDAGLDLEQPVQLGYYDGLHGFKALHDEITQLNLPENRPVQTEKEKKIPRNAYDPSVAKLPPADQAMAARFTTKESAALDAADNPTGLIANVGMRLEALRTELKALPDDQKEAYLSEAKKGISKLYKRVSDPQSKKPLVAPQPTKEAYDFVAALQDIAQGTVATTANPAQRQEQVNTQLTKVERFLFQVEGLNAINLQRGVDTPKSARTVNQDWLEFSRGAVYKEVEWVNHRKDKDVYLTELRQLGEDRVTVPVTLPNNTQDAIGRLVALTNEQFVADPLESQELKAYDGFLLPPVNAEQADVEIVLSQIQTYNSAIAKGSALEAKALSEKGPALQLQTKDGVIAVTNLTRFDTDGQSPLWEAVQSGVPLDIAVVKNNKLDQGKSWQTEKTHHYAVTASVNGKSLGAIGTLSEDSALALAEAELRRTNPKAFYGVKQACANKPQQLEREVFQTLLHETGGLNQRDPETVTGTLTHAGDKEEGKAIKMAANAARREWAATIPPEDREYWARLAWSNRGQPLALAVFPDVVSQQLETFQFKEATVIGLQYEDWEGVDWTNETTLRLAIGTEAVNPETGTASEHHGKTILQAQTEDGWKLVGTLGLSMGKGNQKDYQYPIGLVAEGTLVPEQRFVVTTEQGLALKVTALPGADLQTTVGDERRTICFVSEVKGAKKALTGYIADTDGTKLARLDKDSVTELQKKEQEVGKIFNQPRQRPVSVTPNLTKTGTLVLNPSTVKAPAVWSKRSVDSWVKTLEQTGADVGQVNSEPGVSKQEIKVENGKREQGTQAPTPVNAAASARPTVESRTATTVAATGNCVPLPVLPSVQNAPTSKPRPVKAVPTSPNLVEADTAPQTLTVSTVSRAETPLPVNSPLGQQYEEASARIRTVLEDAGQTPTAEQVDQAIAASIYRNTPDIAVANTRLQILTKSPVTQALYQEQGFEAAAAYVNTVTVTAYQRVHATKTKAAERNGNGRS